MRLSILGHKGFVGSNLAMQAPGSLLFGRENVDELTYGKHDVFVICAASGNKRVANADPKADADGITQVLKATEGVKCNKVVLVSTIDVYGGSGRSEHSQHAPQTAYAKHRDWLEMALRVRHGDDLLVLRLPSIFGPGLKKNVLFDLLQAVRCPLEGWKPERVLNLLDQHQWYGLPCLLDDMSSTLAKGLPERNLFTEPICNATLLSAFPKLGLVSVCADEATAVRYDHRTTYGGMSHYHWGKEKVLYNLESFIRAW